MAQIDLTNQHSAVAPTPSIEPIDNPLESSRRPLTKLFSSLVESCFDLLDKTAPLSLSIYLHAPHDSYPTLFVRRPELTALTPSQNFRLMHTLTMLSNSRKPAAAFRHGDAAGHYVRTHGPNSDGLHVVGPLMGTEDFARVTSTCDSFGQVLHQFHANEPPPAPFRPQVSITEQSDDHRADVSLGLGDLALRGSAVASSTKEATAKATIAAMRSSSSLVSLEIVEAGFETAAVVALRREDRKIRFGFSAAKGDPLRTISVATMKALGTF